MDRRGLSKAQKFVLAAAFVPMLATGVAGGIGTYSNVSGAYGDGTALGAVAAGEGATAVLALVLLGLTMLGQSAPAVIRAGLWALPAAASAMAITAAESAGEAVIYAVTPMGMTVAAEGMAFLARRIVVHQDGRDVEAETRAAGVVRSLAYHRARAANHPSKRARKSSERRSWKLARRVGDGDDFLAAQLLTVQRKRVQSSADAALQDMFGAAVAGPTLAAVEAAVSTERPAVEGPAVDSDTLSARDTPPAIEPGTSSGQPDHEPQVICGAGQVHPLTVPPRHTDAEVDTDTTGEVDTGTPSRLSTKDAANVIRACWVMGDSIGDAARKSTRSRSYVGKVYAHLEEMKSAPAAPERLALVRSEVTA